MPGYPRYVAAVHALPPPARHQPAPAALLDEIRSIARSFPAIRPRRVRVRRLVAALVSFVDDYRGPWPEEAFDDRAVHGLLAWLERRDSATIPELLAASGSAPTLLDAALRVHAALRQLARGRDDRALPSSRRTLDERLALGSRVAPFEPRVSRGGDPLGDAYHYAATLAMGLAAGPRSPATLAPLPLFAVGPELMWLVRDRLSGSTLFFGNHARLDRMGLAHGLAISGRRCRWSP